MTSVLRSGHHAGRVLTLAAASVVSCGGAWAAPALTATAVNAAAFSPLPERAGTRPVAEIVRAEVLLDRARLSPGSIDGIDGDNVRAALGAYQALHALPVTSRLDNATWEALVAGDGAPAIAQRRITPADEKGPFVRRIPAKFEAQARLKRLGYASPLEGIAEQVHASPSLLRALNPRVTWTRAGTLVDVPQVVVARSAATVARIIVDKADHRVEALGADGVPIAVYPASIGSEEKPAPSGEFTIRRVIHNPDYTYNPKYAFHGVTASKPFTIAPGPNNPVGSVWMDLSFEGYGIHGTPQPDLVGKTQSHGCIRLTNWDAEVIASMVKPGTPVSFSDVAAPLSPAPAPPVVAPAAAAPAAGATLAPPGTPPAPISP